MEGEPMLPRALLTVAQAEAILSEDHADSDGAASLRALHALVLALRAPARPEELAAQARTVQAFAAERKRQLDDPAVSRATRRAGKVVAITTAVALAFGGAAAAAVTAGVLPGAPWRQPAPGTSSGTSAEISAGTSAGADRSARAHSGSGSGPAGSATASAVASPTATGAQVNGGGPDATGVAAYGLCHAYAAHPGNTSVAMRNLAAAAAAAGQTVPQYCAAVLAQPPGHSSNGTSSSTHPSKPPHPTKPAGTGPSKSHPPHPSKPAGKPSNSR
jgi:hypothetical protein